MILPWRDTERERERELERWRAMSPASLQHTTASGCFDVSEKMSDELQMHHG